MLGAVDSLASLQGVAEDRYRFGVLLLQSEAVSKARCCLERLHAVGAMLPLYIRQVALKDVLGFCALSLVGQRSAQQRPKPWRVRNGADFLAIEHGQNFSEHRLGLRWAIFIQQRSAPHPSSIHPPWKHVELTPHAPKELHGQPERHLASEHLPARGTLLPPADVTRLLLGLCRQDSARHVRQPRVTTARAPGLNRQWF
jgi:hypothetical protein